MTVVKRAPATETAIQDAVARHFDGRRHELTVPNIGAVFGWEADVLSLTTKGLVHEVEIKISRGDWLRELRAAREVPDGGVGPNNRIKWLRHQHLRGEYPTSHSHSGWLQLPSYFWVAAPAGVILDGELPDYCGLLLYGTFGGIDVATKAPRLHREPVTDRQWRAMARGLSLRYWKGRRSA